MMNVRRDTEKQQPSPPVTKFHFTKERLTALRRPRSRRMVYHDSAVVGLSLSVQPGSGSKTFFWFRRVRGQGKWLTIGGFPAVPVEEARGHAAILSAKAARWKALNYEGPDPFVERSATVTLGAVLEKYLSDYLPSHARHPDEAIPYVRWQFSKYLSSWRGRPLGTISREDVKHRHAQIAEAHGAVTANRCVTLLRTLYNFALDPDAPSDVAWHGVNPCAKPKRFLAQEESRSRVLTDAEAPRFFAELARESNRDFRDFLLLALATGSRFMTLASMRWSDVNLARGVWLVPNAKGRLGKEPELKMLVALAVAVLKQRPRVANSEFVFPGRNGSHLSTIRRPWKLFKQRAGLEDFVVHDLRRTHATKMGEQGADPQLIQASLGHEAGSQATAIYNRSARHDELADAITTAMGALLRSGKTTQRKLLGPALLKQQ